MDTSLKNIAELFSGGKFEQTYPFLADDIQWNIIGEDMLTGKQSVVEFCDRTALYFSEVTNIFSTYNVIVDGDRVAINGKAEFTNKEGKTTVVSSCDVYVFDDGKVKEITSYCITK
ncbi:MAG: nuclear transport factor 2 family protein [bacterium]|nr:nuclear transport factor 2 family protein [bacterium]